MKNRFILAILVIAVMAVFLTACEDNPAHSIDKNSTDEIAVGKSEEAHPLVSRLKKVQVLGTALLDTFNNFDSLSYNEKNDRIKTAEEYTSLMNDEYQEIIRLCKDDSSYEDISYQAQLLSHIIPMSISNDETSIDNAEILYQMYFQQLSSSFSYFAEDTERINNNEPLTKRTTFFEAVPEMARPDTIIYGISAFDEKTEDGVLKYTYKLGENATDAQMNYNLYLIALGMDTGLTLQFDGATTYVYDGKDMVSAIMAGEDTEIGNYFMVSFPEK